MLAGTVIVGGMASLWQRRGGEWGWVLLVGLYAIGTIWMVGARGMPAVLVAASGLHFVAWYFTARAIRTGAPALAPGTLDGRPGIFAVAFYGALLLAVLLVRGGFFPLAASWAIPLAFVLFVLGLLLMERGRFLRMREGAADRPSRKRGILARALAAAALVAGLFFLFAKPVPAVADGVVKMVLDLQGKTEETGLDADDMPDLDDVEKYDAPGREPGPGGGAGAGDGSEQVAGDPLTQTRSLPDRADLQQRHAAVVHLRIDNELQAGALSKRPLYVRSSTLGKYSNQEWSRVGDGVEPVWFFDEDDGRKDGRVTLKAAFPDAEPAAEVRYKIFIRGSSGAGLLGLQGVHEFGIPQVQRYDDDWYRANMSGNIAYHAASRPLVLDDLLASGNLRVGDPGGGGVYLGVERTKLNRRIAKLLDEMPPGRLEERLLWLQGYFAANYQYSKVIENPDLLDPLENFLFVEKRGYCDFFATAGALLVRMMGVPSRVGYGYSKGEFDGKDLFTFHADEAHSWTEIFLDGEGWVVFDVTPSSAGGSGAPGEMLAADQPDDLTEFREPGQEEIAGEGRGDDVGEPGDASLSDRFGKNSAMSDLVGYVIFCVALLLFGLWYYLKRDPEREAMQADGGVGGPRRNLPAYLAEFCALLRALGLDPQHGETLVEMLKSLRGAGVPVESFDEMKRYHYGTRYADDPKDPKMEKLFLQEVRAFLKNQLRSAR